MVTPLKEEYITETQEYVEYAGLSTDDKPTGENLATGSVFCEVNTGKVFFYNAAAETWVEQFSFQA